MNITYGQLDEILDRIAKEYLRIDTLEKRNSDSLDVRKVSVRELHSAMIVAFCEGMRQQAK